MLVHVPPIGLDNLSGKAAQDSKLRSQNQKPFLSHSATNGHLNAKPSSPVGFPLSFASSQFIPNVRYETSRAPLCSSPYFRFLGKNKDREKTESCGPIDRYYERCTRPAFSCPRLTQPQTQPLQLSMCPSSSCLFKQLQPPQLQPQPVPCVSWRQLATNAYGLITIRYPDDTQYFISVPLMGPDAAAKQEMLARVIDALIYLVLVSAVFYIVLPPS